jgi:hypothetical protein
LAVALKSPHESTPPNRSRGLIATADPSLERRTPCPMGDAVRYASHLLGLAGDRT